MVYWSHVPKQSLANQAKANYVPVKAPVTVGSLINETKV